jgi:hypothetical protein
MTPICVLFSMVQSLTMIQYFAREKLDSLKDLTWGILDAASTKKNDKKVEKKAKQPDQVNSKETPQKKPMANDTLSDSSEIKDLENKSEKPESNEIEKINSEKGSRSDKSSKKEKKSQTTDQSSITTSGEIDKEDLKELNKIFWKMRIARFFISDFVKIGILCISYIVRFIED